MEDKLLELIERLDKLVTSIEDTKLVIEKRFSMRKALARGIAQGLGFVLGSTIIAGILYAFVIKFVSPDFIQQFTLSSVVEQSLKDEK